MKECDLAIIILTSEFKTSLGMFISNNVAHQLDSIITLGYPNVGLAGNHDGLAHSGEVNGYVELYATRQKMMIISADVAPGNSGCPVINELGQIVGVVTEDLEINAQSEAGSAIMMAASSVHHAAIPSSVILDEISALVIKK